MRLRDHLTAAMSDHPGARVSGTGAVVTHAELLTEAAAKTTVLASALPAGSRILLSTKNYPGYISSLLAVLERGDLPILADPGLSPREIGMLAEGCGIDAVITDAADDPLPGTISVPLDDRSRLLPAPRRGPRPDLAPDTEIGRLTSGSTRTAACIEFSAAAVLAAATTWIAASGLTAADRCLCFAGLYNGLAFNTTLIPGLLVGADLILPSAPPTGGAIVRRVVSTRPTVLTAFPAAYERLSQLPDGNITPSMRSALAAVRLRLSSAAPLDPAVAIRMTDLSGPICDYYGLAETGPVTFDSEPGAPGGKGRPLPGVTIDVRPRPSDGTEVLHVRTASMGTRYLNYPGEFEKSLGSDGSYITSDTGSVADGRLRLGPRAGTTIDIGGRKFSPEAVRIPLLDHPGVVDCHVLQLTTPSGRACVGALVEATAALDTADLRAHLRGAVAEFKVPEVIVVGRLPRGTTGKVKSAEVRRLLTATFTSASGRTE
ncbi:class I adenylate-forming enzyme family protein [Nocardia nova]|uniref:class I adenylate-forming enzyme family protein n=1 Tax=Nocardia nova TaxID=37330 RepID=UPI0033D7E448